MHHSNLFGALRATTIVALCAGAGLGLAGCGKTEAGSDGQKPATGGTAATEKPAGEKSCGADKGCSAKGCSAKSK